jgi:CHAD domain-containing protein
MEIELKNLQRPLRKLGKEFRNLSEDPSEEDVHKLRTQARRLEAILTALALAEEKDSRRLLKEVAPVRKAAGGVRDMDVLTAKVLGLTGKDTDSGLVRLTEHLGGMRMEGAHQLFKQVSKHRKTARRRLKQHSQLIEKEFPQNESKSVAVVLQITEELSRWPRLTKQNLHPFRLKVKELRYILQLADDANSEFVDKLGQVKDRIGDWHDWLELSKIASEVLDGRADGEVLKRIKTIEKKTLQQALATANGFRQTYLGTKTEPRKLPRTAGPAGLATKGKKRLAN